MSVTTASEPAPDGTDASDTSGQHLMRSGGHKGRTRDVAGSAILPPTYFMGGLFVTLGLHFTAPLCSVLPFPLNWTGLAPSIFGAYLNIRADQLFKQRKTTVKPFQRASVLITEGPFAWCRHPMYLGMVAILLGMAMICGSLSSFLGMILFWIVVRLRFIPAEERSMTDAFGEEYDEYRTRVRSWI